MNLLSRLKQNRKAQRLYNELLQGETALLVEYFPFVKQVFTPKVIAPPPPPPKKPSAPPRISFNARSEQDDLRDALDIGFDALKFDAAEKEDRSVSH